MTAIARRLSVWDASSIIIGIVVGSGIFRSTPDVAQNVSGVGWLIAVWAIGGAISLCGAVCYAELATAYPDDGGEYVYLSHAFGRRMGLVYAWAQLWVLRPGSIGAVAYVFAEYAATLLPNVGAHGRVGLAALPVVVLTGLNVRGVREGKWTQNVLTLAKVAGLLGVVAAAFAFGGSAEPVNTLTVAEVEFSWSGIAGALVLVMFTFGGWNDMPMVAAEVRDPGRNLLRALLLGTASVTAIYLLVNFAFVYALGIDGLRATSVPATDTLARMAGSWSGGAVSALICIACLGALNGMIFTGARVFYAIGMEHAALASLAKLRETSGSPARALLLQAGVTLAAIVGFGLTGDGFMQMIAFTAAVFWFFVLLVGLALFVLRRTDAQRPRPYRVWGYPATPALFCAAAGLILYSSMRFGLSNATAAAYWAVVLLGAGFLVAYLPAWRE